MYEKVDDFWFVINQKDILKKGNKNQFYFLEISSKIKI